jgi:hypothetical protein
VRPGNSWDLRSCR